MLVDIVVHLSVHSFDHIVLLLGVWVSLPLHASHFDVLQGVPRHNKNNLFLVIFRHDLEVVRHTSGVQLANLDALVELDIELCKLVLRVDVIVEHGLVYLGVLYILTTLNYQ